LVISVDYRLAPEHKFSAAVEDSIAAVAGIYEIAGELGGAPARLAVGGDSAGGNLAAVVALSAKESGQPPIKFQLLIYPVVTCDYDSPSMKAHAEGQLLTVKGLKWFWEHYLNESGEAESPLASPLKAASLAGLPPAHVVTAEFDPLLDEGEIYARRLKEAGVVVTARRYDGLMHGFLTMTATRCANAAIAEMAAELRKGLE
jgi:acetyl esterase